MSILEEYAENNDLLSNYLKKEIVGCIGLLAADEDNRNALLTTDIIHLALNIVRHNYDKET